MINHKATTDENTAVERWENEGGKTSPAALMSNQYPHHFQLLLTLL